LNLFHNNDIEYIANILYKITIFQHDLYLKIMNLVTVKSKFQVNIPVELHKSINLEKGDIIEVVRVDDGIQYM